MREGIGWFIGIAASVSEYSAYQFFLRTFP
jgi:hypothetical protein